eukprot:CAMPEP_0202958506 /NCGR_PEP_ID=MMETSP1396-20130829/2835_1 /ASSEMBLY_ACC=CAM_ASM_000872 /TAXON_ID= /ORGANISM="Pseudokeronopsis sp., Strain Brazil" /LENGTH=110 /DNA_ID=CAMNT_0049676619 /DNA_START=555 /DNA_END=888 /DNA_ORIENTATION=+
MVLHEQGNSKIVVEFEKNTFEPHDKCHAKVQLKNNDCNIALSNVRLAVEQDICIQAGHHTYRQTFNLTDDNEPGVGPHEEAERKLDVDLKKITYPKITEKKKKGVMKAVS